MTFTSFQGAEHPTKYCTEQIVTKSIFLPITLSYSAKKYFYAQMKNNVFVRLSESTNSLKNHLFVVNKKEKVKSNASMFF